LKNRFPAVVTHARVSSNSLSPYAGNHRSSLWQVQVPALKPVSTRGDLAVIARGPWRELGG
jgi:hypothetical protein